MSMPRFGRVQLRIMHVLWEKGRANAREITDALNEEEPIAHSTVQTLLRKLEVKGAISHEEEDRTFIFFPQVKEKNVTSNADCYEKILWPKISKAKEQKNDFSGIDYKLIFRGLYLA